MSTQDEAKKEFSSITASLDDRKRYREVAFALMFSTAIAALGLWLAQFIVEDEKVSTALKGVSWLWKLNGASLAGIATLCIIVLATGKNLTNRRGAFLTASSFFLIVVNLAVLVAYTGGISSSVFGPVFLSLLSVSWAAPKSRVIKKILLGMVVCAGIAIVASNQDPTDKAQKRDLCIFLLSVSGNFLGFWAVALTAKVVDGINDNEKE